MPKKPNELNDYEVGHSKPPKDHQFKPGKSGNPRGRPKGSRNLGTVLQKEMFALVTITENGRRKRIPKIVAAFKHTINKAAIGDMAALKVVTNLYVGWETRNERDDVRPDVIDEADQRTLQSILKRVRSSDSGKDTNEDHV